MTQPQPAPRSCLSVPGSSARMIAKAVGSVADEVVIDLEDAVALEAKDAARAEVVGALASVPPGRRVAVRINAVGTPWCHQDLIALGGASRRPDSIVVPKTESAEDLGFVVRLLHGVTGSPTTIPLQALVESAAGLTRAAGIATATGVEALILGYADLAADLGRSVAGAPWDAAREQLLWAARAAGIRAVDGPHLGTAVDDDFAGGVANAVVAGFDAKWVIHPAQIETVNAAFSPGEAEIAWARRVLDALDRAADAGLGAVALDGAMLDEAVAVNARRVLARTAAVR